MKKLYNYNFSMWQHKITILSVNNSCTHCTTVYNIQTAGG